MLHIRGRAVVAAYGDDLALPSRVHGDETHHQGIEGGRDLVKLTPARATRLQSIPEKLINLMLALAGDGVGPTAIKPRVQPVPRHGVVAHGDVTDHTIAINNHGDIAASGYDRLGHRRFKRS